MATENNKLVRKFIWGVGASILTAFVVATVGLFWTMATVPSEIKHNREYSLETRDLVKDNKKAIQAISKQGETLVEIATSMKFIEKSGDKRNKILDKLLEKNERIAEIQASRGGVIEAVKKHLDDRQAHK